MKSLSWSLVLVVCLLVSVKFSRADEPFVQWPDLVEKRSSMVFLGTHQFNERWVDTQCGLFSEKFATWLKVELPKRPELDAARINHRVLTIREPITGYYGCRLEVVGWRQTPPRAKFVSSPWRKKITQATSDACADKQAELERKQSESNSPILAIVRDESSGNVFGPAQCRLITLEAQMDRE